MVLEGDGIRVDFHRNELERTGLTVHGVTASVDSGIEYVMDNRGLLDNLVTFLGARSADHNLFLEHIMGKTQATPLMGTKSSYEDLSRYELNESQRRAIDRALRQRVTWFWGPPGTGKTRTLGVAASHLLRAGHRVLLVALSNTALDQLLLNATKQLSDVLQHYSIVRLGSKESMDPLNVRFSRSAFDGDSFAGKRAGSRWFEHVSGANMVAANFASLALTNGPTLGVFSHVIVDEISMANVPTLAVASYFARDCLLLGGDPMQLPPIYPEDAEEPNEWFRESAFVHAKIDSRHDERVGFLDTQYRMQTTIGELVSKMFYNGELRTGTKELSLIGELKHRFVHVDVKGEVSFLGDARNSGEEQKRFNAHHARTATKCVLLLMKHNIAACDIGVIAPYNAQVVKIREALSDISEAEGIDVSATKVSTIHSFQGQERRAIIVDFTDNDVPPTRLTAKKQLVNVSLSRAKEYLIVIGNRDYLTDGKYFPEEHRQMFEAMFQHVGQTWRPK
jgi:superfamily I DNA and/or RNA helicase